MTMKKAILILAMAACSALGFTYKNDPTWAHFKKQFFKTYSSIDEEIRRYNIFQENMQIAAHYNDIDPTASYGITPLSDKQPSEFLTPLPIPADRQIVEPELASANDDLPTNFNWCNYGAVVTPKDQGSCGSCWAFASVACVEGAHYVKSKKLVSLSEQELVDCDTTNTGCYGGWPSKALTWVKNNGGLMTEDAYPYTGTRSTCAFDSSKSTVRVETVYTFDAGEPVKMQEYLKTYGPLTVAVDATKFNSYLKGIMTESGCSTTSLNHAVTLVGWGVDASSKKEYWIIKNSWGTSWGENGYVKLVRGVNACGVETYPEGAAAAN